METFKIPPSRLILTKYNGNRAGGDLIADTDKHRIRAGNGRMLAIAGRFTAPGLFLVCSTELRQRRPFRVPYSYLVTRPNCRR